MWGRSTRFSQSMEMSRLTRDGTAETVSRGQIIRREHEQGQVNFPCSADNVQDGQPYTYDPYTCYPEYGDEHRLTRDGTAEPVSRDQIFRHARGQRNIHFSCSADHEQDWQPCPVDPYSAICDDYTYIHICSPRRPSR